jgi:hypothetical protein
MKRQIETFTDKIRDRIIYTDIYGNILHSGDTILFTNLEPYIYSSKHNYYNNPKYNNSYIKIDRKKPIIGVFYHQEIKKECKIFFSSGNKNAFVRTLYDKDFSFSKNKNNVFQLKCIKANFENMDEQFKQNTNYHNAINAYIKYFNK